MDTFSSRAVHYSCVRAHGQTFFIRVYVFISKTFKTNTYTQLKRLSPPIKRCKRDQMANVAMLNYVLLVQASRRFKLYHCRGGSTFGVLMLAHMFNTWTYSLNAQSNPAMRITIIDLNRITSCFSRLSNIVFIGSRVSGEEGPFHLHFYINISYFLF